MRAQLLEYQCRAVDFIIKRSFCGVCIAPELGKEIIGLSVIWQLLFDYFTKGRVIIIVERGGESYWEQQLCQNTKFADMSYVSVRGSESEKQKLLQLNRDIYFADNNTVGWMIQKKLWNFEIVIIDDLTKFNHEKSKHFRGLYQQRTSLEMLVGFLPENHKLEELWAEWVLIDGGRSLGMSKSGFYERYFFKENQKLEPKNDAKVAIYKALSNTMYWIGEQGEKDIPTKVNNFVYVELDAKEYSKYQWFEKGNNCYYDLMQLANGIWCDNSGKGHCLHDKKVWELIRICTLHRGRKIVVLCWFPQDMQLIMERVRVAGIIKTYEDGLAWQEGKTQVGLVTPTDRKMIEYMRHSADVVIWFSLNESQDIYQQVNESLLWEKPNHRTWVYHLISRGTVDEELVRDYIR